MKRMILFSIIVCVGLLAGCTSKEVFSEQMEKVQELKREIANLEKSIMVQQGTIEAHEKRMDQLEAQAQEWQKAQTSFEQDNQLLQDLLYHAFQTKTALLKGAELTGGILQLQVQYVNFMQDENEPNGFRLEESEDGIQTIQLDHTVPIYWIDRSVDMSLKRINSEEILEQTGLLQLVEVNDEVVFIFEKYIP
jgi:outer membrane murein-binding lipoprotein Lpp